MKKILITGIHGFVGKYLLNEILKQEKDSLIYGTYHFDHEFIDNTEYKLYKCNIQVKEEVETLIKNINPDEIYHLAALSSVSGSFDNIINTMLTNCMGTAFILEAIKKYSNNSKILIIGSSNEYGKSDIVPIKETNPKFPPNPYALSKLTAGYLGWQYFTHHNIKAIMTRSFNHTGPGQALGFVIPDFCNQISLIEKGLQEPIINVGNIDVSRDFLDVRDVVSAYVYLMKNGEFGNFYNVCSGNSYNIRKILEYLIALSDKDIKINILSKKQRKTDINELYGDNNKLKSLGWNISHNFFETLEENLNFWREKVK